jgi:uncharacterized protein (TIGR02391 family)
MAISSFNENQLRKLSEIMADAYTHRELSEILTHCGIVEVGGQPKWERALLALRGRQEADRCGNNVGAFIQVAMDPVRFVGNREGFDELRIQLNKVLAFSAMALGEDGKLRAVSPARTLSEAEERAGRLRHELTRRRVHTDVLNFCRAELLQGDCFHAVLEATKSLAQKIRDKTGVGSDGADLVQEAFAVSKPLLAINSLQTDTEKSEQKGFVNLMVGMFGTFRNVTAHAPKIHWKIEEQDALDLLSLVSYLHRRLDAAVKVPRVP